jgi:hypothetical protein
MTGGIARIMRSSHRALSNLRSISNQSSSRYLPMSIGDSSPVSKNAKPSASYHRDSLEESTTSTSGSVYEPRILSYNASLNEFVGIDAQAGFYSTENKGRQQDRLSDTISPRSREPPSLHHHHHKIILSSDSLQTSSAKSKGSKKRRRKRDMSKIQLNAQQLKQEKTGESMKEPETFFSTRSSTESPLPSSNEPNSPKEKPNETKKTDDTKKAPETSFSSRSPSDSPLHASNLATPPATRSGIVAAAKAALDAAMKSRKTAAGAAAANASTSAAMARKAAATASVNSWPSKEPLRGPSANFCVGCGVRLPFGCHYCPSCGRATVPV